MIPVVTAARMRALEEAAEQGGTSVATLMQRAGEQLASAALGLASPTGRFQVVCGTGNNGGDGMVGAIRLHAAGRKVAVQLVGKPERLGGEPRRHWASIEALGLPTGWAGAGEEDVVVDALFGTGLNRAPSGAAAEAIAAIQTARSAGAKVVAADLPSGLPSDGGPPFEPCVRADLTVTFGAAKLGAVVEPGASICGALKVVEIGLPVPTRADLDQASAEDTRLDAWVLERDSVRSVMPARRADSHKGTYGHVLVVAGSVGKTGAAALCALGALRAGAGLVTVAARPDALPWIQLHAPEVMGVALEGEGPLGSSDLPALLRAAEGKDAQVMGPGIPRGEETGALISGLLVEWESPSVLDADALNALAPEVKAIAQAKAAVVLTPHPGEMARLCGVTTREVGARRLELARTLATDTGAVVVLKGARTVIARRAGPVWINPTGNPGMATGGTGDVLSGICGGLLGQGLPAAEAAAVAVFAHGAAGDRSAIRRGQAGLIASDLLDGLGEVWADWGR